MRPRSCGSMGAPWEGVKWVPLPSTIPRGCSASQKWSRAVSTPCSEQHFPLSSPAWGQLYGAGGWRRQSKAVLLDPAEPSQSPRCAQHQRAPGPQLRGGLLEHHRCCAPPNGTTSVPTPQAGTKLPQPGKVRAWLRGAAPGPIPPRKNPPRSISSIKVGAGGCPPPQTTSTYLGHRLPGGRAGRAPRSTAAPSSRAGPWLRRDRVGGCVGCGGATSPDFIIRSLLLAGHRGVLRAPAQGPPQQLCSGGGEDVGLKGFS